MNEYDRLMKKVLGPRRETTHEHADRVRRELYGEPRPLCERHALTCDCPNH